MKMGAEPKKIAILGGLLVVAIVVLYVNYFSSDDSSPSPRPAVVASAPIVAAPAIRAKAPQVERHRSANNDSLVKDWKPRLGFQNPEDRPDPATVDPTLRLDLLAKVQSVEAGPPGRNLFDFGQAPPPPPVVQVALPKVPQIAVNHPIAPVQTPPPPGPPPAPKAPPMTFKYYGYKVSALDGHKAAFLLDGEDILIAGENDTFKRRYRVVKIGVTSITIEDTQFKSTQTLPLQEMAG
jgi:hypothetical protein